jgi:hypothetical protein
MSQGFGLREEFANFVEGVRAFVTSIESDVRMSEQCTTGPTTNLCCTMAGVSQSFLSELQNRLESQCSHFYAQPDLSET